MNVLYDAHIKAAIKNEQLLVDWADTSVKGASYDIRTGGVAILIKPKEEEFDGYEYIALGDKRALGQNKTVKIEPGFSCTLRSREIVKMPSDVVGILFNRMEWVHKRLNFDGGLVDPGYHGYLFMTVTNMGDTEVEITYEHPLVALVFIRLEDAPKKQYPVPKQGILEELPAEKLPPPPSGLRYGAIQLSQRIDAIEKRQNETDATCRSRGTSLEANRRFIDSVLLGALAGVSGGAMIGVVSVLSYPWNVVAGAGGVAIAAIVWCVRGRRNTNA